MTRPPATAGPPGRRPPETLRSPRTGGPRSPVVRLAPASGGDLFRAVRPLERLRDFAGPGRDNGRCPRRKPDSPTRQVDRPRRRLRRPPPVANTALHPGDPTPAT